MNRRFATALTALALAGCAAGQPPHDAAPAIDPGSAMAVFAGRPLAEAKPLVVDALTRCYGADPRFEGAVLTESGERYAYMRGGAALLVVEFKALAPQSGAAVLSGPAATRDIEEGLADAAFGTPPC